MPGQSWSTLALGGVCFALWLRLLSLGGCRLCVPSPGSRAGDFDQAVFTESFASSPRSLAFPPPPQTSVPTGRGGSVVIMLGWGLGCLQRKNVFLSVECIHENVMVSSFRTNSTSRKITQSLSSRRVGNRSNSSCPPRPPPPALQPVLGG